jgi:hypothetical protein
MATELQKQLNLVKQHQVRVQSLRDGRPSIFLSAKEAAGVDTNTVYEAAITGLQVLIQYDARFEPFLNGILHVSSIGLQRELKTKEVSLRVVLLCDRI